MKETVKTKLLRDEIFFQKYFSGKVLDIGCGDNKITNEAEPFDIEHGDANKILDYLKKSSYDTVHSSHCLEHMFDPKKTIQDWFELVKPEGYLVTVVPEE